MAKDHKRGSREAKKPKAAKQKSLAASGSVTSTFAKPTPGAATAKSKK